MEKKKAPTWLWTTSATTTSLMFLLFSYIMFTEGGELVQLLAFFPFFISVVFARIMVDGIIIMVRNKSVK